MVTVSLLPILLAAADIFHQDAKLFEGAPQLILHSTDFLQEPPNLGL